MYAVVRMETYVVVDCCHDNRSNHHQPVCEGDVDLAVEFLRGMVDLDMGEVGELHDLR